MDSAVTKDSLIEVRLEGLEHCHNFDIRELNHIDSVLYVAVTKDQILDLVGRGLRVAEQWTATTSTVLHLACQYGSLKCVQHILSVHESLLLVRNSTGETALHLAAREGTIIQCLIRAVDVELETALHVAARYNHKNVVQMLLKADPSHIYPGNKYAETPLYLASIGCYTDIVKSILENSESPTFGGPNGRTALHAALLDVKGHACLRILLEKKRDLIKKADSYWWTAFLDNAIIEVLVVADKYVGYLADAYCKTALHVAAYQGHERVMKELLKYYPDSWESVDGNGQNIFHIAVEQDKKNVIKFILTRDRTAINKLLIRRDTQGNTPLHLIAKLGCYVAELRNLKAECVWEVLNEQGQTLWDILQNEQTNYSSIGDHLSSSTTPSVPIYIFILTFDRSN